MTSLAPGTDARTGPARPEQPASSGAVRRLPAPPTALVAVAGLVAVATTAMAVAGAWQTGTSWDEAYHVGRMRSFLEHGWYLLEGDLDGDRPGSWEDQAYVYAPVTAILMHLVATAVGVEGAGEVSASAEAYAVRHLVIVVIGLAGTVAVGATVRVLLGSWRWGLVGVAAVGAIPMWTGHAMFNVKDTPVATGCTLVTLGLVLLCARAGVPGAAGRPGRGRVAYAGAFAALLAGWLLAAGTRPGIWPTLVASHVAAGVVLGLARRAAEGRTEPASTTSSRAAWAGVLGVPVVAWCCLLAVYPAVFSTPVRALWESATSSSRFDGRTGQWYYVPALLVGEMPLLLLALALLGTVVALRRVLAPGDGPRELLWLLVGTQAFTLPVLAVVRESNLYNGLRQLLFMVPPLAVLATLGIAVLVAAARRDGRRAVAGGVLALVALAILAPTVAQARLYPYNYAFASWPSYAVAQAADTDYWRTSARELAPRVPGDGWVTCSPALDEERRSLRRSLDGDEDCAATLVGPLAPYADARGPAVGIGPTEFWALSTGPRRLGTNCEEVAAVTRPGPLFGLGALVGMPSHDVMTRLGRCQLVLPAYDGGRATFGPGGDAGDLELGGWTAHSTLAGIGLDGERAQLGLALPTDVGGPGTLELELDGTAAVDLNGVALDPEPRDDGGPWTAAVPVDALDAYGDGRVVVTVSRLDAAPVRLHALTLTIPDAGPEEAQQ